MRQRPAARQAQARKAFAEAVAKSKAEAAAKPPSEADDLDPEAPALPGIADAAAAKAAVAKLPPSMAKPAEPEAPKGPPAPSLDPEVRRQREQLKAERDAIAAERAALAKERESTLGPGGKAPPIAPPAPQADIETYLENAPSWFRASLEAMRGDKLTDDEFKSEVADLVTMLTGDVLGVPLPDAVRMKLDAAQAKKIVKTNRQLQTKREQEAQARAEKERAEAAERQENERVEQEWTLASQKLTDHMRTDEPAKTYQWLAAEDDPGAVIVDVIRATLKRDGTKLAWNEAAKLADDYLKDEHTKAYNKRQALLGGKPNVPTQPKPVAPTPPPAKPVVEKPAVTLTPSGVPKWNRDKHLENTRAAFRNAFKPDG